MSIRKNRKRRAADYLAAIILILLSCPPARAGGERTAGTALQPPVRGVWITATDSEVLSSRENIARAMERCRAMGLTDVFVTVWIQGKTLYRSAHMNEAFYLPVHERYRGRDPLAECVQEGHKRHLRVHAWFEYGFASSYGDGGGHLLRRHPAWTALTAERKAVVKNGFYWMNGIHPDVQNLLTILFHEVVSSCAVDGVQGDDRLPALPVEGGYDEYTKALYASEHEGKAPPLDCREPEWIKWRCSKLNLFLARLSASVRKANPRCMVSMAPSIYPWSRDEYLQDWPAWLGEGTVDFICPQVYRRKIEEYMKEFNYMLDEVLPPRLHGMLFPGVLVKIGKYRAPDRFRQKVVEEHRKRGISGEVYFFYEGL